MELDNPDGSTFPHEVAVMPDSSHLIKNIRGALFSYDFMISEESFEKAKIQYGLSTRLVSKKHIEYLDNFQKDKTYKYAPNLHTEDLQVSGYKKMRVSPAQNVCSEEVATGLRMVQYHHSPPPGMNMLTTAYAMDMLGKWYSFASSRSSKLALSLGNPQAYQEAIKFLEEFMELISGLTFVCQSGNQQKPIQAGVRMWTAGILFLAKYYLEDVKLHFFLCGRISSDCIENYFSQMRRRHPCPTGLEFQRGFKALLILQHTKPSKHGNHSEDDTDWYTSLKDVKAMALDKVDLDAESEECVILLGDKVVKEFSQENGLAYVVGYFLKKTICTKSASACVKCQEVLTTDQATMDFQTLIANKEYVQGKLILPSLVAYKTFSFCESSFNLNVEKIKTGDIKEEEFVDSLVKAIPGIQPEFPKCHLKQLVKRFVKIRLHFWLEQGTIEMAGSREFLTLEDNSGYASKTMGAKYMTTFKRH